HGYAALDQVDEDDERDLTFHRVFNRNGYALVPPVTRGEVPAPGAEGARVGMAVGPDRRRSVKPGGRCPGGSWRRAPGGAGLGAQPVCRPRPGAGGDPTGTCAPGVHGARGDRRRR
ncbi:hypothetical protein ACWC19_39430, partial [Streptomyces sp. 900105245]